LSYWSYYFKNQFIIRTDVSFDCIIGVLLQKDEFRKERSIHYINISLKLPEQNYEITDLEGTAAAYYVKKFKSYIGGNPHTTLLYTDNKPLVSLFKNKETYNSRKSRWVFSMLKVEVIYKSGKMNVLAGALSRLKSS